MTASPIAMGSNPLPTAGGRGSVYPVDQSRLNTVNARSIGIWSTRGLAGVSVDAPTVALSVL